MLRELTWYPPAHLGMDPLVLTDHATGRRVHKGSRGLGAVKREVITQDSPWSDGTSVEEDFALPRSIMLPMSISGADRAEFLTRLRTFERAMRTRAPGGAPVPGELELAQADGRRFRLRCFYRDGLPDEETVDTGGDTTWCRFQLQLLAPDPYWYAAEPTVLSWVFADPVAFLGTNFLPLRISPSNTIGAATIINDGTESALGTWRITRPGTDLVLLNNDTGQQAQVTGTIPVGQVLTIVTDPAALDIVLSPSGVDWWDHLQDGSALWEIPPGTTSASLTLTGATSASRIELEFTPRFGSPW
jgi:hypothetical protein